MSGVRYRDMQERLLANSVTVQYEGVVGECWVWIGAISEKGYGTLSVRVPGRPTPQKRWAHRLAFEVFRRQKLQPGDTVDHRCECPACINPDHHQAVPRAVNSRLRWQRSTGKGAGQ
jgi:hypothetical protein